MPTAAMEHSMSKYRGFANATVLSTAQQRKLKEREEIEAPHETQQGLVRRSNALQALAEHMAQQNEKMLEGLRALSSTNQPPRGKVDYIARNVANVGAARPTLGRKEQALMARAEVMAAATAHLGGTPTITASAHAPPQPPQPPSFRAGFAGSRLRPETEQDLVAAALAEIQHGQQMSAFESKTRRAPPKKARP
jgi:hypothetical protein